MSTSIEWTDETWNPVRGCSRVSEGCRNCYAERVASRFSGDGMPYAGLAANGKWTGKTRFVGSVLDHPLRWKRPRRIFVNSMSDLFHESLSSEQMAAVFGVMAAAPQHTFQVLTKRPARMVEWFRWARGAFTEQQRGIACAPNTARAMLDAAAEYLGTKDERLNAAWRRLEDDAWPLPNVWLGVSVENQAAADQRIPLLLQTPAAVRFLSCEPLLGPVDLAGDKGGSDYLGDKHDDAPGEAGIDWVIAGGESGHGARTMQIEWAESLRDQCRASGVAFFMKQLGGARKPFAEIPDDLFVRQLPEVTP